jgi:hypothetical protein
MFIEWFLPRQRNTLAFPHIPAPSDQQDLGLLLDAYVSDQFAHFVDDRFLYSRSDWAAQPKSGNVTASLY